MKEAIDEIELHLNLIDFSDNSQLLDLIRMLLDRLQAAETELEKCKTKLGIS